MSEDFEVTNCRFSTFEAGRTIAATDSSHSWGDEYAKEVQAELDSYRTALNVQAIVAVTDRGGTIIGVNDLFCAISQHSRSELLGQKHSIVNSGHHSRGFFTALWRAIGRGEVWHGDICNRAKDGSLYWVDTTIVPKRAPDGRISGYVSVRYDITKRKQAETALLEENAKRAQAELLLRDVIEALPNGIAAYDADDQLVLFNSTYKEFYEIMAPAITEGASFETILRYGVDSGQFVHGKDSPAIRQAWFEARMQEHRQPGRQLIQQLNGGRWLQVQETLSQSGHIVGVRTDITALKLAERQIQQQAERDYLTGLYNRRALLERLDRLASGRQSEKTGALLLADLDGFKAINDTFGHDAGDALLVEVANRFRSVMRKSDIVARYGGDEFALLVTNLGADQDAERIAEKLLRSLEPPMKFGARHISPAASFGIALFPRDGLGPDDLIKHADMALYQAKGVGRSTFAIYNPTLRRAAASRAGLIHALPQAMARNQIEVALQPQASFVNGRHTGFEALVRWQRCGKSVPPVDLISVAEETGLIVKLGYYIADKALAAIRRLHDAGLEPGPVAINIAAAQLRDPDLTTRLCALIARHRLRPVDVEVEITENVMLDRSVDVIGKAVHDLHQAGIGIALDDFGTGYASLAHLKRFPLNRLKIDRSFVGGMATDPGDAAIARAIISLAHGLGLQVVAEGVETRDQYRMLSNLGCDYAQGYLIAKPLMAAELEPYMAASSFALS